MQSIMDFMSGATPDPYSAQDAKASTSEIKPQAGSSTTPAAKAAASGRFSGRVVIVTGQPGEDARLSLLFKYRADL